jgi:hypothetical protein
MKKRIQLTVDEQFIELLDKEASRINVDRPALVKLALTSYLIERERKAYEAQPITAEEMEFLELAFNAFAESYDEDDPLTDWQL